MGDASIRFFNWVMHQSSNISSVFPLNMRFQPLDNAIRYKCMSTDVYENERTRRHIHGPAIEDLTPEIRDSYPRTLLMPKKWTKKQSEKVVQMYNDPKIHFIVFPVLCSNSKYNKCRLDDGKKHTVLLVYNKSAKIIELWDDRRVVVSTVYGMHDFIRLFVEEYFIIPVLVNHFKFDLLNYTVHVPTLNERYYGMIKKEFDIKYKKNSNYLELYSAFLVEYIKIRIHHPLPSLQDVYKKINIENLFKFYEEYVKYNKKWNNDFKCESGKIINPETGKCVAENSDIGREILGIEAPCEGDKTLNIDTNKCEKINMNQYFIDRDIYLSSDIWFRWDIATQYFLAKYKFLTLSYSVHEWMYHKQITGTVYWEYSTPPSFENTMEKALKNNKITHIVYFILITGEDRKADRHMNVLIIDKNQQTIERYEPWGETDEEDIEEQGLNNGKNLDDEIQYAFEKYNLTYIPPAKTCPYDFQSLEHEEDALNLHQSEGNCAIWAIWYMDLRLSNLTIPRDVLTKTAYKVIKKQGAFHQFIHSYHDYLQKVVYLPRKERLGLKLTTEEAIKIEEETYKAARKLLRSQSRSRSRSKSKSTSHTRST